jgi:alpha-glucosidase/alpha-D-xyloside xylohydrolase
MYYDGTQQFRPDERVFALHRNGHAGMARYAPFLWSGDVYTTWETLRTHVAVAINTGLSGIPYWGTDIGGFVPTPEYTGELHVRWFQFGAFCPLFRAHGRTWHLRLPWGWNTGQLGHDEIASYRGGAGNPSLSELNNAKVEPICRKYLELRYRLMPYLYTAVRETHDTGLPIMRALWLHYPDDPLAAARSDAYLWGRDILVAPVLEPGVRRRPLYLPRGLWYDYWTEEPVHGGREISPQVDLETTPLYVRAGAILPLGPVKQYTSEAVDAPLTLVVYPGADGTASIYEDDGHTFAYQRGEWMRILAAWDDGDRRLSLRLAEGSRTLQPMPRRIDVRIAGSTATQELRFNGNPVEVRL